MRILRLFTALLIVLLFLPPCARASNNNGGVSAGYFHGSGAAMRNYAPEDIPAGLLTHIDYAFAQIDRATGKVILGNPERDEKNLSGLRALREKYPHLKLLIAVGGWDGSLYFSDAASTAERREIFARSCLDLIVKYGLDGVDINWEYPVSGGAEGIVHRPSDRENFTLLLRAVRDKLNQQGRLDGKEYCLTATGAANANFLKKIEPSAVSEITDYIFLMAYDYGGPWAEKTGFNAPLDRVRQSAQAYLDGGVPAGKLVLGMPLYGHQYRDAGAANGGLNTAFSSASSITYDAVARDCLTDSAYILRRHPTAQAPYLFNGSTFISYDDPESIAVKASLAKELGLAGVGYWELSQDSGGVLLQSARSAFMGSGFEDVALGSWYFDAVAKVCQSGWMTGTSDTAFSPDEPVTRGMFAAVLHRMEGEPDEPTGGVPPFSDIKPDSWCAATAAWAAENGVVNGFEDGTFRPDKPVTREQIAVMLWRYAKYKGLAVDTDADLTAFQDAGSVGAYARDALAWAVDKGLLQGREAALLAPGGSASRAETAALLVRFNDIVNTLGDFQTGQH